MQQRDILLDQIELAGRVIGKAIARYFDLKSSSDVNQAIQETKITLQSQIDLDIDAIVDIRNVSQLQAYLRDKHLNADHLDLLNQFLFDAGSELSHSQPLYCHKYLSASINVIDAISYFTEVMSMDRMLLKAKINDIMPKKLIILSDMYGYDEESIPDYMNYQIEGYACQQYDVSTLAEIDLNKDDIHLQYVEHGISKAVNKLLELENEVNTVIAFSVGGTIGWRAALKGLKLDHLIAVSSTRLRLENVVPECKTTLLFGENDQHKPSTNWSENIDIQPITIPNEGHEIYKSKEIKIKLMALLSDSQ